MKQSNDDFIIPSRVVRQFEDALMKPVRVEFNGVDLILVSQDNYKFFIFMDSGAPDYVSQLTLPNGETDQFGDSPMLSILTDFLSFPYAEEAILQHWKTL